MPQGQLKAKKTANAKKTAANRHGKHTVTKKGALGQAGPQSGRTAKPPCRSLHACATAQRRTSV